MICPHCNRTIREEQRYMMSTDPNKPGIFEVLRGEGGEAYRIVVTLMVCVLVALAITGISQAAGVHF